MKITNRLLLTLACALPLAAQNRIADKPATTNLTGTLKLYVDSNTEGVRAMTVQQLADYLAVTQLRSTNNILAWASAEAYQPNGTIQRISGGPVTNMPVKWPDGATGIFTGYPNANGRWLDAYQLTYILNGVTNTVTQYTISRDSEGSVTQKPLLNFQ